MSRAMSSRDAYTVMLKEYPDVMNTEQMSRALGISTKPVTSFFEGMRFPA